MGLDAHPEGENGREEWVMARLCVLGYECSEAGNMHAPAILAAPVLQKWQAWLIL